jgi:hypothetical protein
MNAWTYTNRGEEVPLGVECALPYCAGGPLQNQTGTFPAPVKQDRDREIESFAALRRMFAEARAHSD